MEKKFKYVVIFFIASFACTWLFYFSIVAFGLNPYNGTGMWLLIAGGCSPTAVGIIMVMLTYQKEQRVDFFKSTFQIRRIKPVWLISIILIFPIIHTFCIGVDYVFNGNIPQMTNLKAIISNPLLFFPLILLSFMSGPFSEELGWRGFALNPLLSKFGFAMGSIILGILWSVWHLPLYFMPETWHGQMGFAFSGFWVFIISSVGMSCMMSWVYINTKRSILSAMLMHLFSNFTAQLLDRVSPNVEIMQSILYFIIGMGLCFYMIPRKKKAEYTTI